MPNSETTIFCDQADSLRALSGPNSGRLERELCSL